MIPAATLNAMIAADSVEALWAMHVRLMEDYGFDRLIYGHARFVSKEMLGDPEDVVALGHDGSGQGAICAETCARPMLRWAMQAEGAQSWATFHARADAGRSSAPERAFIDFKNSAHLSAGYTISFPMLPPRTKGAISLGARRGVTQAQVDALWNSHGEDILLVNNLLHLRLMSLPCVPPNRVLTPRQREALEWIADGKTVQDAAVLMNLMPPTVEKHLRLARGVLNATTTIQAVLKAASQNQIFLQ